MEYKKDELKRQHMIKIIEKEEMNKKMNKEIKELENKIKWMGDK